MAQTTFTAPPATDNFEQNDQTTVDGYQFYNWGTVGNWSSGNPVNGGTVGINLPYTSNPASLDDIQNLYLDSLTDQDGFIGVLHTLTVANLNFTASGTAVSGGLVRGIYSYSLITGAPSLLTIDSLTGSGGIIQAVGTGAVTNVLALTDPGEYYEPAYGGEVIINSALSASSSLYFDESAASYDTGIIALEHPGATFSGLTAEVEIGDVLELPGSFVASATFGTSSMSFTTSAGTYAFSDVEYVSGFKPTGFTAAFDPVTGLEAITFTSAPATDNFVQTDQTTIDDYQFYNWGTSGNWSSGIPVNGGTVGVNLPYTSNPASLDDIQNLYLDSLTDQDGFIGVLHTLTVANLNFTASGTAVSGGLFRGIYSYSLITGAPSLLTIDSLTGSGGIIQAVGTGAVTNVLALTDPGEYYEPAYGGEVIINSALSASSSLYFDESAASYDTGIIALEHPGATFSGLTAEVEIGDVLELPGSFVASATFGTSSMSFTTSAGTYAFSDVEYVSGFKPTGFTAAFDPVTGLEAIRFTSAPATDNFEQNDQTTVDGYQFYNWGTVGNWSSGNPVNGGTVGINLPYTTNPASLDDIQNLYLDSLTDQDGFIGVLHTLTVANLNFTASGTAVSGGLFRGIYSYSLITDEPSLLTIDSLTGSGGIIQAVGTGAVTNVLALTDPGEYYEPAYGGEVIINSALSASSSLYFDQTAQADDLGIIALVHPNATFSGLTAEVEIGDVLELPGSFVSSATFGASSMSITTSAGTYAFSDVDYVFGEKPTGFTAAFDPVTGLEAITFAAPPVSDNFSQVGTTTVGDYQFYNWGTVSNWSSGIPVNGGTVGVNLPYANNPMSLDDLTNLFLDSLTIQDGVISVDHTLTVVNLNMMPSGPAVSGGIFCGIYSYSLITDEPSLVTIDSLTGSGGVIQAVGTGAVTDVLALTDPGEIYQSEFGGEVIIKAALSASSSLCFGQSDDTGIIALEHPGATVSALTVNVAFGDVLELPGSSVFGVTFGASSMTIVTSAGTTVFTDVEYETKPTGFIANFDTATGLEAITFTDTSIVSTGNAADSPSIAAFSDLQVESGATVSDPVIAGGTLDLGIGSTLSGNVTFSGSGGSVIIDSGSAITNTIVNFGSGDSIELQGVPYELGDTVEVLTPGVVTVVTTGNGDFNFNIAGATQGETGFSLSSDLVLTNTGTIPLPPRMLVWAGAVDTNFANAANWDDTTLGLDPATLPPSAEDTAAFNGTGGIITGTGTAAALSFEDGSWHLTTGGSLTTTGSVIVGTSQDAALLIDDGASLVEGAGATIASAACASGSSVNVTGTGSDWQIAGTLNVGLAGAGALSVTNGGSVAAGAIDAGTASGGFGDIVVNGSASQLTATGDFIVGDRANADVALNGGGTISAGTIDIGLNPGASGVVDVEGDSVLNAAGVFNVGDAGNAVLSLGADATVNATSFNIGTAGVLVEFGDPINSGTVTNSNSIVVAGGSNTTTASVRFVDNGLVEVENSGTETITTPLITNTGSLTGTMQISTGGELVLNAGSVAATQTIQFADATGTLLLGPGGIGGFDAVIQDFVPGDTIIVDTYGAATFSQTGSVVSVIQNGTTLGVLTFDTATNAGLAYTTAGALVDNALCFLAGTLIGTPDGERPVQDLAVGDRVLTASGVARPVVWVGQGRVLATRGRRGPATPVIVRKGALGANVPHRDLHVTKGHALLLDGVLIPVEFLVNHRSVLWDDRAQEVVVYHVELATHDVLVANGAAAESYRDDGNRWLFANANAGWDQPPKPACAPVLTGGAVVDAVWRRLLERAGPRPSVPLTDEADVHLMVDGVRVEASTSRDGIYVFSLRSRPDAVRIVSRAAVPQELGLARDPRLLGVALRRVVVRQGTRFRTLGADDAALTEGFHAFEPDAGVRWTDGDAMLPSTLFDGFPGACEVVVHLGGTATYIDDGDVAAVA